MPRGKPGKASRPAWEVDFVSVELSKEQKKLVQSFDEDLSITMDTITTLVGEGYKLTCSGDKAHDCVAVYLTSPKSPDGARQQCLGARGPDLLNAMRAIVYKHSVILEGEWGTLENNYDPSSQWG